MKTNMHLWLYLAQFFLEWEMFQTKVVEKIKAHILCWINFFPIHCAVYEIIWKNVVQLDRPQLTVWGMHFACWIPKATHTHTHTLSKYVILMTFPLQQWLHKRASMLHYLYMSVLLILNEIMRKSITNRKRQYIVQ
jgi:hypothetical protein